MNRALRQGLLVLLLAASLGGCDKIDHFLGDGPTKIKRAPGERIDVVLNQPSLQPDAEAADVTIDIPEQANLTEWHNHNDAMRTAHAGLTGIEHHDSAEIGEGNEYSRNSVASPIVAQGMVMAMDARGVVSAHDETDIDKVRWVNKTNVPKRVYDVLGGGLAYDQGVVYVTTGYGSLRAISAADGVTKWSISVGAPVRGAPALGGGMAIVLTADNQTLAFDAATGAPRWEHRGIRETAGYFSSTAPVISDGIVIAAYSSGEVFAIRAESGSVLWNDTLATSNKTLASAVFSGIDADPIVQDGVVVVTSAAGEMQASALLNGRPLWQQRIGSHSTPWSAGNALFVLSATHDVAAILKRDGKIRWAQSMASQDSKDPSKDTTPPLFGPILAGNAILVVDRNGELSTFKPQDGKRLGTYDLKSDVVSEPVIANGALYLITQDATLHKYY